MLDVHDFAGADGSIPFGGGNLALVSVTITTRFLFGVTWYGGANNQGVIFALNTLTRQESVAHSFNDTLREGKNPSGGLIYDANSGNFYGCCYSGGDGGHGTLYALHRSTGAYTVLHAFAGYPDGAYPWACPILGPDGFLYGTTPGGGLFTGGVVYKQTTTP